MRLLELDEVGHVGHRELELGVRGVGMDEWEFAVAKRAFFEKRVALPMGTGSVAVSNRGVEQPGSSSGS